LKALRIIGAVAALLAVLLALPVDEWRTGDQGLMPLESVPVVATPPLARRLWIDTDAACGQGPRIDPDDCFAIALLARSGRFEIVGVSAVAGNAPLEVVERTTRELAAVLSLDLRVDDHRKALQEALEQGPLTILALGPLTNIAAALAERPALAARVERLVAVMGRRPGHLFHPAEGAGGGMLFGHGPVFRDFNFVQDIEAASRILALGLPMSLVPYDAARGVEITAADLDRMETTLPWIARRARGWLEYWRTDIGRDGFFPFDLLAAAYVLEPSWFRCTPVDVRVAEDRTLFIPFWRPTALLVAVDESSPHALYCGAARGDVKANVMEVLIG
jgi:inosine-uridine nucleoside N-ribohydrolase